MRKKTNPNKIKLIYNLKYLSSKEKKPLWKRIAKELERPTKLQRKVNLYKIDKYIKDDETAIIPGKVLSLGNLNKKITIAAFQFSKAAKTKINKIGKAISIEQLIKENPKGNKVRILG